MSTVAALRATLGLDGSAFRQGLNAAKGNASSFSSQIKKLIAPLAGAIGLAFSGAAIRNQMDYIDAQAKMAQSLGTTSASLQVMERAGELAGVSLGSVEQSAKDLQRRLSQAASGTGPVAEALKKLQLNAKELIDLPLDQRIATINGAIEKFIPAAQRAAIAGQLFGEEGSLLMTRLDPKTIAQAAAEIDRLGYAISEVDAGKIEQANDAISALGLIGDGLISQITVALAPALDAIARGLAGVLAQGGPVREVISVIGENVGRLASYALAAASAFGVQYVAGFAMAIASTFSLSGALAVLRVALVRSGIGLLIVGAGELVYWLSRVISSAGGVSQAIGRIYTVGKATFVAVGDTARGLVEILAGVASSIVGSFVRAFATIASSWDTLVNGMATAWNAIADTSLGDTLGLGVLGASNIEGKIGAVADGMFAQAESSITKGAARIKAAGKSVADAMAEALVPIATDGVVKESVTQLTDLGDALDDVEKKGGGASKSLKKTKEDAEKLSDTMRDTKEASKGFFTDVVTRTKSLKDAFADLLQGLATMLANSAFEKLWSGALSGDKSGGGLGSILGGVAKIFGFANGTQNAPGGLAIVGERGKELVNLPRGSQVIPAEKTRQMLGASSASHTRVDVDVSVSNDGQLKAFVTNIATREAQSAAKASTRATLGAQLSSKHFTRAK